MNAKAKKKFKDAYAILAGIPQKRFSLEIISNKPQLGCGTLACGIGWLLHHPTFRNGFELRKPSPWSDSIVIQHKDEEYLPSDFMRIGQDLLGISFEEASEVFSAKGIGMSDYDEEIIQDVGYGVYEEIDDKTLLLYRMRRALGQDIEAAWIGAMCDA